MQHTDDAPDAMQCMMRARSLMDRSRYADAAEWLQRGIQAEPNEGRLYAMLALCWMNVEGSERKAVDAARRAVGLDPEESFPYSVLALALGHSAKDGQDAVHREALAAAEEAVRLDPDSDLAHTTKGRMLLHLRRWAEAEASARRALELDPDDSGAAEVLSACLMHLGKHEDHDSLVNHQLQNNAESDTAHSTAGWNALRKGDSKKANEHFMEALRLNPLHEGARLGLIESYRARSFFYRGLLKFDAWIAKVTAGRQMQFMIGGYLVYRLSYNALEGTAPWAAHLLAGCWLLLVFWSTLARGASSFLMLFDRFARRSLKTKEKWEGLVIGGMVVLALGFLVFSFFSSTVFLLLALGLFLGAVPAASAFTNDHYIGKWVYWAVAVFCIGCALYPIAYFFAAMAFGIKLPMMVSVAVTGIWTAVIFTWVRMFNIGYR